MTSISRSHGNICQEYESASLLGTIWGITILCLYKSKVASHKCYFYWFNWLLHHSRITHSFIIFLLLGDRCRSAMSYTVTLIWDEPRVVITPPNIEVNHVNHSKYVCVWRMYFIPFPSLPQSLNIQCCSLHMSLFYSLTSLPQLFSPTITFCRIKLYVNCNEKTSFEMPWHVSPMMMMMMMMMMMIMI